MSKNRDRLAILEQIERGEISPEEGARLLKEHSQQEEDTASDKSKKTAMDVLESMERGGLSAEDASKQLKGATHPESSHSIHFLTPGERQGAGTIPEIEAERWRRWWQIPLWIGFGILLLGGFWMNGAYQSAGAGLWFYCAWAPVLLGLLLMVIGAQSRNSRWLHVRVRQSPGEQPQNIVFSMPLPLRSSVWVIRNFGRYIPNLDETGVDEIIEALEHETGEAPFYVEIEDDEGGEQVTVFVG